MSGSDDTESQCDRTSETNGVTMGDVLAKDPDDNDSHDDSIDSDDDPVAEDQRQEADGAPDALDVVPENFLFEPVQMEDIENAISSDEQRLNPTTILDKKPIARHPENCSCESCTAQRFLIIEISVECGGEEGGKICTDTVQMA
uniref:Uncharacterized protein n=1 Tax=Fopius arisanus TaxID=64838 RepID=A0A0C9RGP3_9HYME